MDRDVQLQQQQQPVLIEAYEDEIDRRSEKSREVARQKRVDGQSSGLQRHPAPQQSRIASRPAKPAAAAEEKSSTHDEACAGEGSTSTKDSGLSPPAKTAKRRRDDQATDPRRVLFKSVRGRGDIARGPRRIENRDVVDHTYHDFSRIPPPTIDFLAGPSLETTNTQQERRGLHTGNEKSFPLLLHKVLSMEEFAGYVSWRSHGRAFRILNAKRFESVVCPEFFGHSRYGTFIRNLANWGFKYITQGHDRSCYYHEAFLYDLPHLTKYMSIEKNRRKVAPDPKNEPDFYLMNKTSPLPRLPDGKCGAAMAAAPQEREAKSLDGVCSSVLTGESARPTSSPFDGVAAPAAGMDKQAQEGASEDLILARMSKHHARARGEAARTPASMFAAATLAMDPDGFLLTGRNQVRGHEFLDEPRMFDGKSVPMNNFRFSSTAATTFSNQSQQFERSESSQSFTSMHPLQGTLCYRDHRHPQGIFTARAATTSVMDQLESTIDSGILGGVASRLGQQQAAPPPTGRYSAEDLFRPPPPPQHSHDNGSDFFRQHLSQHFAP